MSGGRMGMPTFRGSKLPSDDHPRRTNEAKRQEARHRAIAARRLMRTHTELADLVALMDMLDVLPREWPRDSRGRPYLPVHSIADWVARVDQHQWFRGTLAPCSGPTFRVKAAQHANENPSRECPD